jgi:hypothetical protein
MIWNFKAKYTDYTKYLIVLPRVLIYLNTLPQLHGFHYAKCEVHCENNVEGSEDLGNFMVLTEHLPGEAVENKQIPQPE